MPVRFPIACLLCTMAFGAASADTIPASIAATQALVKSWRTEADFKAAEPMVASAARWLETNLLAPGAADSSLLVLQWAYRVPYVAIGGSVNYAQEPLADTKNMPAAGRIGTMLVVGAARYAAEHPDSAGNVANQMEAGIRSMLTAYRLTQVSRPGLKYPSLDKLQALVDKGDLRAFVCKQEGK